MQRVLEAAEVLFAQADPESVSIRRIAELADVNHALIHRYFGTKDELLAAVLEREAVHFAGVVERAAGIDETARALFEALATREDFVTMLARATLSGHAATRRSFEAGALRSFVTKISDSDLPAGGTAGLDGPLDPRFAVAGYAALTLGWIVFREFLAAAVFIEPDELDTATESIRSLLDAIIASARSAD